MEKTNPEPEADTEVSKKKEDEHLRLQRQVRMIQADRLNRIMGVHPQLRRQDQLLRTLKKEYINLHKDLKIAWSGAHKKNDRKMKAGLKGALLLCARTDLECEGGITLMEQADKLLHRKNKHMLHLKKTVNANSGQLQERRSLSEYRLLSAENKLEAAMRRFNVVQGDNRKIRGEIEHMLNDRALFNQCWSKMLNALTKGKKFLTDLFESSTLAYDQRDEWCTKLKSVQEKGKMDQMVQVQEMRDLQKAFDHEIKLHNFLANKGVMRINKKEEEREVEEKRKKEENIQKNLEIHFKYLSDVNDYTKEHDVDKIIETFNKVEQENFAVYKLLTEFCAENELLRRHLKDIQRDIVDRSDWNELMNDTRETKLEELRQKLHKQKVVTEEKRSKLAAKTEVLNEIMVKVQEIFRTLDCSLEPFKNLLGDKEPSLHHMHLTFELITEKVKQLVQVAYYYERHIQKKGDKSSSRLKKYTVHPVPPEYFTAAPINLLVPADPCPACVEVRWLSRVTDTPEVPFDRDMVSAALSELENDPAFERSDRIHLLTECRVPRSRCILARRYTQC